jgi:membrane-associated phospholipid phosphatase
MAVAVHHRLSLGRAPELSAPRAAPGTDVSAAATRSERRRSLSLRMGRPKLPSNAALLEAAAVAIAVAAFVLIGRLYGEPSLAGFDASGLQLASHIRTPWLDAVAVVVTSLGAERLWMVWIPIAVILVVLRKLPSAAALLVVALGVLPWDDVLKGVYQRARPMELGSGVQAFSFPSGHAMAAGAVYGMLALLAWRELRGIARHAAVTTFVLLALLIAASRPYLGVHYPTDVIAGLLAGALWTDLVVLAWRLAASLVSGRRRRGSSSTERASRLGGEVGARGGDHNDSNQRQRNDVEKAHRFTVVQPGQKPTTE